MINFSMVTANEILFLLEYNNIILCYLLTQIQAWIKAHWYFECPIKAHPRKILKLNKSTVLVLQMKAKLEKRHNAY